MMIDTCISVVGPPPSVHLEYEHRVTSHLINACVICLRHFRVHRCLLPGAPKAATPPHELMFVCVPNCVTKGKKAQLGGTIIHVRWQQNAHIFQKKGSPPWSVCAILNPVQRFLFFSYRRVYSVCVFFFANSSSFFWCPCRFSNDRNSRCPLRFCLLSVGGRRIVVGGRRSRSRTCCGMFIYVFHVQLSRLKCSSQLFFVAIDSFLLLRENVQLVRVYGCVFLWRGGKKRGTKRKQNLQSN